MPIQAQTCKTERERERELDLRSCSNTRCSASRRAQCWQLRWRSKRGAGKGIQTRNSACTSMRKLLITRVVWIEINRRTERERELTGHGSRSRGGLRLFLSEAADFVIELLLIRFQLTNFIHKQAVDVRQRALSGFRGSQPMNRCHSRGRRRLTCDMNSFLFLACHIW